MVNGLFVCGELLGIRDTKKEGLKVIRVDDGLRTFNIFADSGKLNGQKKGNQVQLKVGFSLKLWNGQPQINWNLIEVVR